jgi:hypothetical protein
MGTDKPMTFSIEQLAALGGRLHDAAEDLAATLEFEPVVLDLKLAARAISRFASLRFQVAEIASDGATTPAIRRDLLIVLEEASQ